MPEPQTKNSQGESYVPAILRDGAPMTPRRARLKKLWQKLQLVMEAQRSAYAELAGPPSNTFEYVAPDKVTGPQPFSATPDVGEKEPKKPSGLANYTPASPAGMLAKGIWDFAHEEAAPMEAGTEQDIIPGGAAGFGENAARTLVQFGLLPVDVGRLAVEELRKAQYESATGLTEEIIARTIIGTAKEFGKGAYHFTVDNLRDAFVAANPMKPDDDPEKKAAWERIYATGGIGPLAAASGATAALRGGVKVAAQRGLVAYTRHLARQAMDRRVNADLGMQIEYRGKAPLQLGYEPTALRKGEVIRLGDEAGGPPIERPWEGQPLLEFKPVVMPERPVAPLVKWIRNLKPDYIERFTDAEARTELRRYLIYIGKEEPRLAEKFVSRLPETRVKELLQKANERHGGLPAEPKNVYYDEGIEVNPNELPVQEAPTFYPPVAVEAAPKQVTPTQVTPMAKAVEAATPTSAVPFDNLPISKVEVPGYGEILVRGERGRRSWYAPEGTVRRWKVASPEIQTQIEAALRETNQVTALDPGVEMGQLLDKVLKKKASPEEAARFEELANQGVTPAVAVSRRTVQRYKAPPAIAEAATKVTAALSEATVKRIAAQEAETPAQKAEARYEAEAASREALAAHEQAVATERAAPETTAKGEIVFAERFSAPLNEVLLDEKRFQPRDKAYAQETYDAMLQDIRSGEWEPAAMDDLIVWRDPANGALYSLNHSRVNALRDAGKTGVKIADVPVREFKGTEAEAMRFAREKSNRLATPQTLIDDVKGFQEAVSRGATAAELKRIFRGKEKLLASLVGLDSKGKFLEVLNQPAREGFPYLQNFARWVGEARQKIPQLTRAHENEIFDFLYQDGSKRNWEMSKEQFQNMIEARTSDAMFDPTQPLALRKGMVAGTAARADTGNIVARIEELKHRRNEAKTAGERQVLQAEIDKLQAGVNEIVRKQQDMFGPQEELVEPQITGIELESGGLANFFRKHFGNPQEKMEAAIKSRQAMAQAENRGKFWGNQIGRVRMRLQQPLGLFHWLFTPEHVTAATPGARPRVVKVKFADGIFEALLDKKARLGDFVAAAAQKMFLANKVLLSAINMDNARIEHILSKVSKEDFGKRGQLVADLLDNKPVDSWLHDPNIKIGTKAAALELKEYFEEWQGKIVGELRGRVRDQVARRTEREYRESRGLVRKRLNDAQKVEISNLTEANLRELYPDSWGIRDYLPHILPGQYTLFYDGQVIGSARQLVEVYEKIADHAFKLGDELTPNKYVVEQRRYFNPEILRLNSKHRHALLNDISKAADVDKDLVYEAARGKIGTKEFRDKFSQHMLKRRGAEGYETDLRFILNTYNWAMNRWLHMSRMQRWMAPAIEELKQNNPSAASYLEGTFEALWGRPSRVTQTLNAALERVPVIGDYMPPLATEAAMQWVKSALYNGFLRFNPSFKLGLNNLQIIETLLPILPIEDLSKFGYALRAKAGRLAISDADYALLEKHGVNDLLARGGKFGETRVWSQRTGRLHTELEDLRRNVGLLASETSNQQGAWLTMYKIGRDIGLTDGQAADFAFLRGNLYTQFTHLRSDVPMFTRGPIASTAFMYQRFPIKSIEIGLNEIRNGRIGPAARWLAIRFLLGGQKGILHMPPVRGALWVSQSISQNVPPAGYINGEAYSAYRKAFGKDAADFLMFGAPSIIGWDWTNRFNLLDVPYGDNIFEKVGRTALGIPGGIVADILKAGMDTKGPTGSTLFEREVRQMGKTVPALRPLEWMWRLDDLMKGHERGEYDMRDPAGRLKFRTDLWGVLSQGLLASRPLEAGEEDLLVRYIADVVALRDTKLDELVGTMLREGRPDFDDMNRWNARWPEFSINLDNLWTRYTARYEQRGMTESERLLDRSPEIIKMQEEYIRRRLFGTEPGIELGK